MDFIQYDQPVQMVGEVELGFNKLGPVLFGFEIEVQGQTFLPDFEGQCRLSDLAGTEKSDGGERVQPVF